MADKTVFELLSNVNVNDHTEEVKSEFGKPLTYLSWVWAIAEVQKRYPDMQYEVIKFDGLPYVYDEKTGYMVYTKVTIQGITHEMWLPVMDPKNKAMKDKPYTYTTSKGEKTVEAATMFDINKAIMRCLAKNIAVGFGLGIYIYAGEDLPEGEKEEQKKSSEEEAVKELKDLYKKAGGKDFDAWVEQCGGLNPLTFPKMKEKLKHQINANAEAEKGDKK